MTYALRIRLYFADIRGPDTEPEADTDPDVPEGAPGSERAEELEDVGEVLRELAYAYHEGAGLLGLSDRANGAYLLVMRDHIGKANALTYQQAYMVKVGHVVHTWHARVDVHRI